MPEIALRSPIQDVIDEVSDKRRMSAGISACSERRNDFASEPEMQLAGVAMVPEARTMMSDRLTAYWRAQETSGAFERSVTRFSSNFTGREVIIGAGFHAAVYAANRVRMGFPRPVVLEQGGAEQVGGAFAVSLNPVFRLNSRNRPGPAGLPDQDKALNYLPAGLIQPSMLTSEEYPTNADMAWVIRLALAQYADVYPGVTVTGLDASGGSFDYSSSNQNLMTVITGNGTIRPGRVIDARGTGTERELALAGERVVTFSQLMARMGGMFPLRGMRQVAVIGSGDSGKCAVESLLGIAPGNTSAIGLDYVTRVDWYTSGNISGETCSEFRDRQRGRYIKIAQFLDGNVSNPSTRLRVMDSRGYATALPDGVIVNDRTYDMAVLCTGSDRPDLNDSLGYPEVRARPDSTALARRASPLESYRIGPAANLPFSEAEFAAGIAANPPSKVAMFRLAPRTAALAAMLPGLE